MKTAISATGSKPLRPSPDSGFSLVEVMVAIAIAGIVLAAAVPMSVNFYESMQRRQAVRDAVTLLASARERAISSGVAQDVRVQPSTRRIWSEQREQILPDDLQMTVHGAAQLNRGNVGVIRFYADGSASGGGLDIAGAGGQGARIDVDWLLGRVTQAPLDSRDPR